MIGKCCKKMKNISNVLFLLVMSLLPWAYFIFTPYGFPWFIIPCGILLSLKLVKVARNNKEKLQDKFRLTVHSIFYVLFNAIFIISNLYLGGFPVALLIFNTWSLLGDSPVFSSSSHRMARHGGPPGQAVQAAFESD